MKKAVNITRLNYEEYVIDYIDGNLIAADNDSFIAFLEENPDIKKEIFELNEAVIFADNTTFTEKEVLKKEEITSIGNITELNYEEYFIAHHEGDLNKNEEQALDSFISSNPSLKNEFLLHSKLKIKPSDVVFKDRKSLKRKATIGTPWYLSAAAAILLLFATWFFTAQPNQNKQTQFASINHVNSRNSTSVLPLVNDAKINITNRQISKIELTNQQPTVKTSNQLTHNKIVTITEIQSKIISTQLTNNSNYDNLLNQPLISFDIINDAFDNDLAFVSQQPKKQKQSIFGKIIKNQMAKIARNSKSNKANRKKSNDPAYIKIIDGGLLVFNTLTGNETATLKTYNNNGQLTGYQIEGSDIKITRDYASR